MAYPLKAKLHMKEDILSASSSNETEMNEDVPFSLIWSLMPLFFQILISSLIKEIQCVFYNWIRFSKLRIWYIMMIDTGK